MKEVVGELHPLLKERGFRKQRHTFNRECEAGLTQVVNFQMGPYDVGDPVEIQARERPDRTGLAPAVAPKR